MEIKATRLFDVLSNSDKRINLLVGGAGSSKSYSIAQHIIFNILAEEKNKRILVTRKTLPALRLSAYLLVKDLLDEYQIPHSLNKTELIIGLNTNEVIFKPLDDPEKIKSTEFNYAWIEEATEVTHKDFMQVNLRLRRKTESVNQLFLSCNPISKLNWVYEEIVAKKHDSILIDKSTYRDNPLLDEFSVKELEDLINQDKAYHNIYTLGEWGVLEGLIYPSFVLADELPEDVDETIYGLDFGYNNPSALVKVCIKDDELYFEEKLYETKLTNEDLIERLKELIPERNDYIYADSAEPARIEEIASAGFNIHSSDKSVKDGIDYVRRKKKHITKDSVNLIKEIQGYKYKETKDGKFLEEPLKFRDHLMDSARYAVFTHFKESYPLIYT